MEPNCFFALWSSEGVSGSSCWTAAFTSDCVASKGRSEAFGLRFSSGGCKSSLGGGGMGALFDSPMRRRVSASCAFVGIPLRIVLMVRWEMLLGILFDFEDFLPMGIVSVKICHTS